MNSIKLPVLGTLLILIFVISCGTPSKPIKPPAQPSQVKSTPSLRPRAQEPLFKLGRGAEFKNLQYLPEGKYLVGLTPDRLELLDAQTLQLVRTFNASSEPYTAMAVDRSGDRVAIAQGNNIVLWNLKSGNLLKTLQTDQKVLALSFSPDGQLLASGGYDNLVTLWNPDRGEKIGRLKGHTGWINTLAFHPEGKLLASGGDDGKILLWNTGGIQSATSLLGTLEQYGSEIYKIAFSPNGQLLASIDRNGTLVLWDPMNRRQVATLTETFLQQARNNTSMVTSPDCGSTQPCLPPLSSQNGNTSLPTSSLMDRSSARILSADFSPDGHTLVLGSTDKSLILWNILENQVVKTFSTDYDLPQIVTYSPDGRTLGVAGGAISLWNAEDGQVLQVSQSHPGSIQSLSFSPDAQTLAAGSSDKKVALWNLADRKLLKVLEGHDTPITSLAFSKKDSSGRYYLASAGTGPDHPIFLWDLERGKLLKSFRGPHHRIHNLVFRPDGKQLVLVSDTVLLWDIPTGDTFVILNQDPLENAPLTFSPDGRLLALVTKDNQIVLWDVEVKKVVKKLARHKDPVQVLLFSPSGQALISSDHSEVVLWNVQNGNAILTLPESELPTRLLVFSPDSKFLISPTGPQQNWIALRSIENGQVLKTLKGHETPITGLVFSSENLLATTSYGKIIFWNGTTGQPLKTFEASRPFDFLSFSPDGKVFASGGYDKIILWDVTKGSTLTSLESSGFTGPVVFSPDGRFLATLLQDQVTLWDSQRGSLIKTFEKSEVPVSSVTFSSDGQIIAAMGNPGYKTFASWEVSSGKTLTVLSGTDHKITSLAFDPVHRLLATGSEDGLLLLWDVRAVDIAKVLAGPSSDIVSLFFSPDAQLLASQSQDSILFWNRESGGVDRILQVFPLYGFFFNPVRSNSRVELTDIGNIQYVTVSPDFKTLVVISRNNSVLLLDAQTGQVIKTLQREIYSSLPLSSIIFSPDGKLLALKDELGKVALWNVESGQVLHTVFSTGRVLFSPDGRILVSEGADENHSLTLWDVAGGQIIKTLSESGYVTSSIAFSPDGKLLAVGEGTGTISIYEVP
ncbi:MAG TPA: WD40 repeat domain-containing protein [Candidatus Limnocylindrales bacterium]|nr:WD40 repeat domain-containing protein [Candidatus Limnocylindrales bacterium]